MSEQPTKPYRVLARKYRPNSFETLIGQEALVRTLSNALALGRLAHAFVLTGVRGIGKTSTARILATGLNCECSDGTGGPTALAPAGCANIAAILPAAGILTSWKWMRPAIQGWMMCAKLSTGQIIGLSLRALKSMLLTSAYAFAQCF